MRTAEEHINEYTEYRHPFGGVYYRSEVIHLINEARKEAIEECIEIVKLQDGSNKDYCDTDHLLKLINNIK